jgi:hypothetical protein
MSPVTMRWLSLPCWSEELDEPPYKHPPPINRFGVGGGVRFDINSHVANLYC